MMEESRIFEERSFEIRERQKSLKVSLSCDQRAAGFWQRNARALAQLTLSLSLSPPLSFSLLSSTYIYTYICSVCQSVRGPIFRVPFLKLFAQKAKLADNGREPPLSAPLLQWILQKRSSFLICFPSFCARKIGVKSGAEKRSEVCVNVVCVKLSFFFSSFMKIEVAPFLRATFYFF